MNVPLFISTVRHLLARNSWFPRNERLYRRGISEGVTSRGKCVFVVVRCVRGLDGLFRNIEVKRRCMG